MQVLQPDAANGCRTSNAAGCRPTRNNNPFISIHLRDQMEQVHSEIIEELTAALIELEANNLDLTKNIES